MTAHPSRLATEAFEAQRDRLRAVAYRGLGSHADAEDVVQEAWMRLVRQDAATIGNLGMPTFAQIAIHTSDATEAPP